MKLNEIKNNIDAICKQYNIRNYKINSDGTVDVTGNVDLTGKEFSTLPLKFGKVTGNFSCFECLNLTSLEGAPNEVGGSFYCGGCPNLTSLVGAPSEVGVDFSCYHCPNLTSLEGAPNEVGGDFDCFNCFKLTKLSHLNSINEKLYIGVTPITNLLAVFGIENLKQIEYENDKITNIINKHLKNPDRDEGMIECRQELRDAGLGEYARMK